MRKILILGVFCGLTASCVENNDHDFKRAYVERGASACINKMKAQHYKKSEQVMRDYCECTLNKFANEMSMDELIRYGQDDPKIEQKADKLLDKYSDQCKSKLK